MKRFVRTYHHTISSLIIGCLMILTPQLVEAQRGGCTGIAGYAFEDHNANGQYDEINTGVSGIQVEIRDEFGFFVQTTTTDNTGFYSFPAAPANQRLRVIFTIPTAKNYYQVSSAGNNNAGLVQFVFANNCFVDLPLTAPADRCPQCQAAPIQIGNFVWNDCNGNGIQDPIFLNGAFGNEAGIAGVSVKLFDAQCNLVNSTTTDNSGYYYFNNLRPNTNYTLVFGDGQFSLGSLNIGSATYVLAPQNQGLLDEIDSDISVATTGCGVGRPTINFTTGTFGADHSLDAGFVEMPFRVTAINKTDENCAGNNNGTITVLAAFQQGTLQYTLNGVSSLNNTFNNLAPGNYNLEIRIFNIANVCNGVYRNTITIASGLRVNAPRTQADEICQFDIVPRNGGLRATCDPCLNNATPKVTWWTAAVGGAKVGEGLTFNPIAAGVVNSAIVGATTFFAQCECGDCISERTPSVFTVRKTPEPVITGRVLPCPGQELAYSTPSVANTTWSWTLSGGGTFTTATTGNTVRIRWNNTPGAGPFTLTVRETNQFGCSKTHQVSISIKDIALRCVGSINASLANDCNMTLTVRNVLSALHVGDEEMRIQLWNGSILLEEGLGSLVVDGTSLKGDKYEFINKTFTYKVIEPCTNNTCWGNIRFEDKAPPIVQCPTDVILGCAQVAEGATPLPQDSGIPTWLDCSPATYSYTDQSYDAPCSTPFTALPIGVPAGHTLPTTGDIVRIIVRSFIVADKFGNTATCEQFIFIRRGNLNNVICPPDIELNCKDVTGALTPTITGFPLLDTDGDMNTTFDRFPLDKTTCRITATFQDDTFRLCSGSYKIGRNWSLMDWCARDNPATPQDERRKTCTQIIVVVDKTPPSVTAQYSQFYVVNNELAPRDTTVQFDGFLIQDGGESAGTEAVVYPLGLPNTCGGRVRLTLRADDWSCSMKQVVFSSSDSKLRMIAGSPQFNAQTQTTTAIFEGNYTEYGDYTVTITARDECNYALARKTFIIRVRDNMKPFAVCIENTTVSLGTTGAVRVAAASFNTGSADNCALDRFEVRRMDNCNNPSDIHFKDFVEFGCCDAGKTVQVVFRVYDQFGNFNDCMVNVFVDDKLKPTCIAPAPVTINCAVLNLNDFSEYGQPATFDNCGIKDTVYTVVRNLDNCKIGTITRKWVISDFNNKKDSCTQIITVTGKSDFTVDFPDDIVANCFAVVPTPTQLKNQMLSNDAGKDGHIVNNGCGVIAVEVKDDTLTAVPDACYKILRRIKVIDWCKYNPNNDFTSSNNNCYGLPVCGDIHSNAAWQTQNLAAWQNLPRPVHCNNPRERRFRDADALIAQSIDPLNPVHPQAYADGIICFTQIIKIIDQTPPQFTKHPGPIAVIKDTDGTNCTGVAKLSVEAKDICDGTRLGDEGLRYSWRVVDRTKTDSIIYSGSGASLNNLGKEGIILPYDREVTVSWTVTDRCGNFTICSHLLKVVDGKTPSLLCRDVNVELALANGVGMATVNAVNLCSTPADNCTPTADLVKTLTLTRNYTSSYPSVVTPTLMVSCADAGLTIPVQIWVKDAAGNENVCVANITVQDNLNLCRPTEQATIAGTIRNEKGNLVANVNVAITNGSTTAGTTTTTASGNFSINTLTKGLNYTVTPSRTDNLLNGVTTFDIASISKHILGIEPLNSPYKLIAADVDRNGEVNTGDMLFLRRLILRQITRLPNNNTSWRFVGKNYTFSNPQEPFYEDFPQTIAIANLPQTAQADFVAIKVGDVNVSANASNFSGIQERNARALVLTVEDKILEKGGVYDIPLSAEQFDALGYQFTLNIKEGATLVSVETADLPSMSAANFGQFDNAITTSWNGDFTGNNVKIFRVIVRADKNIRLSEVLSVGSNLTEAEAFNRQGETMRIDLRFKGSDTEGGVFNLQQNQPNPFDSETRIGFNLTKAEPVKLTVYDASGRVLKTISGQYDKGYHEVVIQKSELAVSGVLFYRLETPSHAAVKKMMAH